MSSFEKIRVARWTPSHVSQWLESLGASPQALAAVTKEKIDGKIVLVMDSDGWSQGLSRVTTCHTYLDRPTPLGPPQAKKIFLLSDICKWCFVTTLRGTVTVVQLRTAGYSCGYSCTVQS